MAMVKMQVETEAEDHTLILPQPSLAPVLFPDLIGADVSRQLQRMFRDPRVLEANERTDLVVQLRAVVALAPTVSALRVLLGMALCVDLKAQEALEELRRAVELDPVSFIARLKYGELLMRLRICQSAAEETHKAAQLAANAAQSELARRQAATIRTMLREGIERGGYSGLLSRVFQFKRGSKEQQSLPACVGTE